MPASLDGLRLLPADALRALAGALRADRLAVPASAGAVRWILPGCPARAAEAVAACLDTGTPAPVLADVLDLVVAERRAARQAAADLVMTGPDTVGAIRSTSVVVEELFSQARRRVLMVGFAVHQGTDLFRALARRMDESPDLAVVFCLDVRRSPGDSSPEALIVERFARDFRSRQWPGDRLPAVYFDPRALVHGPDGRASLHAKTVAIDGVSALITSANFTEAAQRRNIELGVLLRDRALVASIEAQFAALIDRGLLRRLPLATAGKPARP